MADRLLLNLAEMSGDYNDIPFEDSKSTQVTVRLVEVPFVKTADQSIWFSGELTYTLTIDNTDGEGPMTDLVITDKLDTSMFLYVEDSTIVSIDDTPTTNFTASYVGGLLTVSLSEPVATGSIATISFRGTKAP